jgi:hypothetical protein
MRACAEKKPAPARSRRGSAYKYGGEDSVGNEGLLVCCSELLLLLVVLGAEVLDGVVGIQREDEEGRGVFSPSRRRKWARWHAAVTAR